MDGENLYDEFGNYIGPELAEDEDQDQGFVQVRCLQGKI